jgi:putative Mg2+ transporter-C (MgtC) family protein
MPLTPGWDDIALRLLLTLVAGVLLGINRSERGKPAGVCTTVLMGLAACLAMILANLLIPTAGKSHDSYVSLDMMRLPLGILTGMGFIGAGAIIRRGDMVRGVTTAAILWLMTVLGLTFGSGQLVLGLVGGFLAVLILWGLKWFEQKLSHDRHGMLVLRLSKTGPDEAEIRSAIAAAGYWVGSWGLTHRRQDDQRDDTVRCEVWWHGRDSDTRPPTFVDQLTERPGVRMLRWNPYR